MVRRKKRKRDEELAGGIRMIRRSESNCIYMYASERRDLLTLNTFLQVMKEEKMEQEKKKKWVIIITKIKDTSSINSNYQILSQIRF